ncbi:MAG: aminomethyl-transferring glycine dehydrogenase subunit GcvPA [Candidatus Zixiibacteriota bacterium]
MPYIPNSEEDQKKMLETIGVSNISDLFAPIPANLRVSGDLPLPEALTEPEVTRHLEELAAKNRSTRLSFIGGGIYNHFVPPVVWTLAMRPEFATAYTPYQAEVAQGTLQIIYEFQSHVCRLTGMDVANASMYDGATAMTEAALLAVSHTKRNKILVSETINPHYRDVLKSTIIGLPYEIITIPEKDGLTDFDILTKTIDDSSACVILGQPNFFGYLEDLDVAAKAIHEAGGLFVMVADPISLGILKTPAEYDADIFVGEGQSLGIPQNFGGPLLGLFACKKEFIRKLPGRLAARTTDVDGKPGFVLTLQTREQHIRRDKATSNICTNEALCATAATIYMSLMGKQGIPRVARLSVERSHYLAEKIKTLGDFATWQSHPFFKEFVVDCPVAASDIVAEAAKEDIGAGIDLGRFFPGFEKRLLLAVTEINTIEDCDRLVDFLARRFTGKPSRKAVV